MRVYETTFILSPQADDASFDRQIRSVTGLIEKYSGTVLKEDRWGIRRLAYPVKKFTQGFYTRLVFEANNNLLGELDRFYRLEEAYIRYLTVVYEGKPIERSEPKPERKAVEEIKAPEEAARGATTSSVEERVKPEEPAPAPEEPSTSVETTPDEAVEDKPVEEDTQPISVEKPEEAVAEVTEETTETVEPAPVGEEPEEDKEKDVPAPEKKPYEEEGEL